MSTGDTLGKDVYVGVEVQKVDPPTLSFFGYSVAEMERILAKERADQGAPQMHDFLCNEHGYMQSPSTRARDTSSMT